ncbi:MAG: hypothetical protein IJ304_01530 [Clostridia bacterium]|nr:hypothetical protein [Clostridia bacterium]
MIIDAVREYMLSCPLLAGKKININCLGTKMRSFSIDNAASESVIKKYCDGSSLKQAVFTLAVRDRYDEKLNENLYVMKLLEEVEDWIYKQNILKNLPNLADGNLVPRSIEVTKSGHLHDTSMGSGRWQLEFKMVYKQSV